MKTKIFIIFTLIFLAAGLFVSADIQYPIEELDNCKNKEDCKTYCDEPKNTEACFSFAEKNNFMSKEEIKVAKRFLSGDINGPGGCKTKDVCEEYCNDINRIDECISFAEENNLIPAQELEEAKKVQSAIARGVKPPPCGNKKSCDVYCEDADHMEECITFGIEAGFIQGKELEDVQKMLQAVKRGVKPPPCKGKEACDEYCSNPDNMEICMNFAIEAGFMSEQEKADSQKMLQAIKKGVKPPPCKGREECDIYCGQEDHFEECASFAEAAGFMTSEDATMARKTGGKGPGGCKGRQECEDFCNNPDNQEICFNFAKDNGMIPEEDLKRMGPPQESGEPGEDGSRKFQPGPGTTNPGGCNGPEECKAYCESNPDECQNFNTGGGEQFAPDDDSLTDFCEGEECQQIQNRMMPPEACQGENCQYGPPPQGEQFQRPPQEFQSGPQQPPFNENPPPPPPPPASFLINPDSLAASAVRAFFNFLFNRF